MVETISLGDRMNMSASADSERFQSGANKYAAYLETPEGRLRSDLAFANLQDFLPCAGRRVVVAHWISGVARERRRFAWRDLAFMSRCWILLRRCWILRSAPPKKQGVSEKIVLKHGEATQLAEPYFPPIVRCNSLPQHSGIHRRSGSCVARCGSRLARFIGDNCRFSCATRQARY